MSVPSADRVYLDHNATTPLSAEARAAIDGISRAQGQLGIDVGAAAEPIAEEVPAAPEEGLGFEPLPGPRGVADDLKKLPGISPAMIRQNRQSLIGVE